MTTAIRSMWTHLFGSSPKTGLSDEECEHQWKAKFGSLLEGSPSVDSLWNDSLRLTRSFAFSAKSHQIELINTALSCAPSHFIRASTSPIAPTRKIGHIFIQLIQKLWLNTLKLFTWSHQVKDLENRTFFDLGDFSSKLFNIARVVGAISLNQCTVEWVCTALAVSTTVAYLAVLASVITLLGTAFFLINSYAEKVLAKPLKDPTFGDTINLTRLMQQSLPLSEAGRQNELDELERALTSPTAEIGVIGEKGCGKSELIKLLAQRVAGDHCSAHLKGKQIYCVNGAQVTRSYIEKLREQIKGHESEIILCIDECHSIFRTGADQILKTLGMGGPKPRIIYVTTHSYFESTFLSEEDGSWLSRIHPRIEIEPINPRDMKTILLGRLQNLLPWVQITSEMIDPFAETAKKDLRKAIKDIDLFAAHFQKKTSSSETLQTLIEETADIKAQISNLSLNASYHEWILSERAGQLASKLKELSQQIEEQKSKLRQREEQQKHYQSIVLLQKKWQAKAYAFWQLPNTQQTAKEKQLITACLWASEVFERKKREITSNGLTTQLTLSDITSWYESQKKTFTPVRNDKKQGKRGSAVSKDGNPTQGNKLTEALISPDLDSLESASAFSDDAPREDT